MQRTTTDVIPPCPQHGSSGMEKTNEYVAIRSTTSRFTSVGDILEQCPIYRCMFCKVEMYTQTVSA